MRKERILAINDISQGITYIGRAKRTEFSPWTYKIELWDYLAVQTHTLTQPGRNYTLMAHLAFEASDSTARNPEPKRFREKDNITLCIVG